jgi:glutamyl-tRNA reductase
VTAPAVGLPIVAALQREADAWAAVEVARARRRLARGEALDDVLDALTRGIGARAMHGSLRALRDGDPALSATVERLFLRPPR